MEDAGQKTKAETLNEAALDMEIRAVREGGGGRGSNASQSKGCYCDSAIPERSTAMAGRAGRAAVCNSPSGLDRGI